MGCCSKPVIIVAQSLGSSLTCHRCVRRSAYKDRRRREKIGVTILHCGLLTRRKQPTGGHASASGDVRLEDVKRKQRMRKKHRAKERHDRDFAGQGYRIIHLVRHNKLYARSAPSDEAAGRASSPGAFFDCLREGRDVNGGSFVSDEIIEIAIRLFCHWAMHRIVTIFPNLEELTPERHGRLEEFKRGKGIFARGVTVQIKADAEEIRETVAFVVVNRKGRAKHHRASRLALLLGSALAISLARKRDRLISSCSGHGFSSRA